MGIEIDLPFLAIVDGPNSQVLISAHLLTEDAQLRQMPALKRMLNEAAARMIQTPA